MAGRRGSPAASAPYRCLSLFYVRHVLRVSVTPNFGWYNFCGALWGASVVLPGLTSSSIMMALGLYEPLLNSLAENAAADPVRLPAGDAADHAAVGPGLSPGCCKPITP